MPLFTTGDGSEETVLFVTTQIVTPLWFRRSLVQAIVLMTQPGNWSQLGDADIQFATDKATEMLNSLSFSEENPLPVYTPLIGTIQMFASETIPDKWLSCDGTIKLIADYPDLYDVIGNTFGTTTPGHFVLPDMRQRVPVGIRSGIPGFEMGDTAGEFEVTLTEAEMPAHTHAQIGFATGATTPVQNIGGARTGSATTLNATGSRGGGEAHNNMQPYLAVQMIIYAGV